MIYTIMSKHISFFQCKIWDVSDIRFQLYRIKNQENPPIVGFKAFFRTIAYDTNEVTYA